MKVHPIPHAIFETTRSEPQESFSTKYITLTLKKYRGVMFHDTEEWWCKIWRKTDLWFGKWHEKFGKMLLEQLKVSKLKIYRRVMYHDNEEWHKIWRGIDLSFQNWHHNLTNFDSSTCMSQKFALNELLLFILTKVYNIWAKKVQKSSVWLHKKLMQNLKENWLALSKTTWEIWELTDLFWKLPECSLFQQTE